MMKFFRGLISEESSESSLRFVMLIVIVVMLFCLVWMVIVNKADVSPALVTLAGMVLAAKVWQKKYESSSYTEREAMDRDRQPVNPGVGGNAIRDAPENLQ